jgi:S-adenosylmethionine:tRNA ribosyltransferase-isomerase
MRTSDFDYPLPPERIAQTPAEPRDSSRLLVLRRNDPGEDGNPKIEHRNFRHLLEYLRAGDLTVFNRSRVIPARLRGVEAKSGAPAEVMLVRRLGPHLWEALVRPGRRLRSGAEVLVGPVGGPAGSSEATVQIIGAGENGLRTVRLSDDVSLDQLGEMPLPPYINEKLTDAERYQTVYGNVPGSVAAPTAGLHFTDDLLAEIRGIGVKTAWVTLHVGLDTFRPVRGEDIGEHKIHTEWYELPAETAEAVNATRRAGGRIFAVGTTTVRTLEQVAADTHQANRALIGPVSGDADLFILPGHQFRLVDGMLTNFHLPRSTLLMLVSAFAGRERILAAYREAVDQGYRFYSFGDAMLIC